MKSKHLNVFFLAMMNVAVVMSLRGLPMMAKEGFTLLFYLAFSALIFLIPTSLVSAELATGWPKGGGVYSWVKEAFGDHVGFTAIWLQWIQNVIWYPTILAFAAGALAYFFFSPELATSKWFNIAVILFVYWGATLINLRGIVASGWLSTLGVICGTFFPGALVILLGIIWIIQGKPLAFTTGPVHFFPDLSHFQNVSFLAGVVLLFAGMEVSAVHANEVKDPKRDYPRAIFLAVLLILIVFTFGAVAIAAVLPEAEISLTAGLMQAFKHLLESFHLSWLLPIMGFLVAFGTIGGVGAWIVGPSKGLFATAKEGDIPPILETTNRHGVPVHILVIQGIVVTLLSLVFLLMPTVNSAFFLLTALTAILYLIMYVLLYATAIRLRYTQPDVHRAYKVPGGNFGMWCVAGLGLLGALFAIIVGFFPPKQLAVGSPTFYVTFLIIGMLVFCCAPLIIIHFRKPSWKLKGK